jgi:hypothetical protein
LGLQNFFLASGTHIDREQRLLRNAIPHFPAHDHFPIQDSPPLDGQG